VLCDFGHIADGSIHLNIVAPNDWAKENAASLHELRHSFLSRLVKEFGASFSAEHGLGRVNCRESTEFGSLVGKQLAGAIKSICAPGPMGSADAC
jgi:FAD/FMN-containing dehydrogenase